MPNPREAVYDVLLQKKQKAVEAKRIASRGWTFGMLIDQFNRNNRRARDGVRR